MKKYYSILIALLLTTGSLLAAPRYRPLPDTEVQTSSGVTLVYRGGTSQKESGTVLLRQLDRELSRLFRAPPGTGGCRIVIDREFTGEITARNRKKVREILLPENFADRMTDPEFRGKLAGEILGGRFGLQGDLRPLPAWIVWGMEGIRQNALDADRIVRNQLYFPILRGLLGIGCMPDFRALMQLQDGKFSGSAREAVCELGRFLLETFSRISSLKQNALGEYVAGVLQGIRKEPDIYRSTLLAAMTSGRYARMTEEDFFKVFAETAAFNYRTPRAASDLLARLPETLNFEVRPSATPEKPLRGNVTDLPVLFAQKKPGVIQARQQIWQKFLRFSREMPPEIQSAAGKLQAAILAVNGKSPEEEISAIAEGRKTLETQLKNWMKLEKYLEECEQKFVQPGLLFRKELSTVSEENEFLTTAEKAFFDQVEKKYLEH